KLYFSGGRGYHCHVLDPKVFQLDSSERREIVDYIIGRDLNENEIFRERIIETFTIRGRKMPKKRLEMPRPNEPGWRGRIGRGIATIIRDVIDNNVEGLKKYGIKEKDIERLRKELTGERVRRILEDGIVDQSPYIRRFFLKAAIQKAAVLSMAGETDEPVTCDVKRLIRLPTSLHGKTGLKVCEIDIDRIDDFDPLYDAVVLGDDPIDIELSSKLEIKMRGERFSLSKGRQRVPEFLAVLLVGRGMAKIIYK
ncbi:MAG TPA: DNA primase catalytic subunit PriS, partial [Thermoplasmatales archaeon]|nr:DNA primase catalytic subunit PriS [Thermoplasmatales archaeon]